MCVDRKDNLNINLRVGVWHISGRSYGAYLLHCIIFYKQIVPMGLNGFTVLHFYLVTFTIVAWIAGPEVFFAG